VVKVIRQQVAVAPGGKAIVADAIKGRRKARGKLNGAWVKSSGRPYKPGLPKAYPGRATLPGSMPPVQAKLSCRGPAMRGKPVSRLHGGKGGGPKGAMAPIPLGTIRQRLKPKFARRSGTKLSLLNHLGQKSLSKSVHVRNCSEVLSSLGDFLVVLGGSDEGIEAIRLALRIDPRDPGNFGCISYFQRPTF
jgi:hypothetical protein